MEDAILAPAGRGRWLDGSFDWEKGLPDPDAPGRPMSRVRIRHFTETLVEIGCNARILLGDDYESMVAYMAILQLADLTGQGGGRGIHVNALARSLNQPFETMRRRCNIFLDRGWVARGDDGLYMTAEMLAATPAKQVLAEVHDRVVAMIERMSAMGIDMPAASKQELNHVAIMRAGLDITLVAVEHVFPWHDCYTEAMIFSATMVANAQDFSYIPEVALRYAQQNTPPPEGLRRPVSASAIARGLNLTYPTTRRHADKLVTDGSLARRPDGVIVSLERLQAPRTAATGDLLLQFLDRAVHFLARNGFPFDDPASAYLGTRPERIIFR